MKPKISIVIPWHFMDSWHMYLVRCLGSIEMQSFTDYEVILTKAGSMPVNTNRAMKAAKGELVKVMYMDDYFATETALAEIVENFKEEDKWLVSSCVHDHGDGMARDYHTPFYSEDIATGNNTIGSPSVLTIRRDSLLLFDENLSWLLDCDLYKRLHDAYGDPVIVDKPHIAIGIHKGQTSNLMSAEEKEKERLYMIKKTKGTV